MLDFAEGQHEHVGEIGQHVEDDDEAGSQGERQRHIAAGIAHLTGAEGDVVPGVGGEERADLRGAEGDEHAEGAFDGDAGCRGGVVHGMPCSAVGEIGLEGGDSEADEAADDDDADQRADLHGGEDVLYAFAVFEAAGVGPGEEGDEAEGEELGGGQRYGIARQDVDGRDDVVRL